MDILCKITIPLTAENEWNDTYIVLSCIFAPVHIQYSFGFLYSSITIYDYKIPIILFVVIFSFILVFLTLYKMKRKRNIFQILFNCKKRRARKARMSTAAASAVDDIEENISAINDRMYFINMDMHNHQSIIGKKQRINLENDATKEIFNFEEVLNEDCIVDNKPVMKLFFLLLGFCSAVAWIEVIAGELVNLLTVLGVISTIDLAILGLTVLAWGNSIGDMIADVSVAKRGYAKMGISAAVSGPTLNVLLGIGFGTFIKTLSDSNQSNLMPDTGNIFISCLAIMFGIAMYAMSVYCSHWRLTKIFGYWCFLYYMIFLVVNVLVYENIIPFKR